MKLFCISFAMCTRAHVFNDDSAMCRQFACSLESLNSFDSIRLTCRHPSVFPPTIYANTGWSNDRQKAFKISKLIHVRIPLEQHPQTER